MTDCAAPREEALRTRSIHDLIALAESQAARIMVLEEALRPFVTGVMAEEALEAAELAKWDNRLRLPIQYTKHIEYALTVGDLRRAAAALREGT